MYYFKVLSQFEGKPLYKKRKSISEPLVPSGYSLIANELFTPMEVQKLNIPFKYLEEVNISKNNTFFIFGARFQK